MKHLRKFATKADMADLEQPNVVLIGDTNEVLYNAVTYPNGVYIQHIDGKLYTLDEWTELGFENADANGVAVKADECSFVVATTETSQQWATANGYVMEGVPNMTEAEAKSNYNGKSISDLLATKSYFTAASFCKNYIFPNGQHGYLGSLGEMMVLGEIRAEVNTLLTAIGGKSISSYYNHWSSCRQGSNYAWAITFPSSATSLGLTAKLYVRPFTTL